MHSFEIKPSRHHAEVALRRFLVRNFGLSSIIAIVLLLGLITYDLSRGSWGAGSTVVATLIGILSMVYAKAYIARKKRFDEQIRQLGDSAVTYSFGESEWSITSPMGNSSMPWESIQKLWIESDLVMLFYSEGYYVTLPTSQVPPEALSYLLSQVKESCNVVDKR